MLHISIEVYFCKYLTTFLEADKTENIWVYTLKFINKNQKSIGLQYIWYKQNQAEVGTLHRLIFAKDTHFNESKFLRVNMLKYQFISV